MVDWLHSRLFPCKHNQIERYKREIYNQRNVNYRLGETLKSREQALEAVRRALDDL